MNRIALAVALATVLGAAACGADWIVPTQPGSPTPTDAGPVLADAGLPDAGQSTDAGFDGGHRHGDSDGGTDGGTGRSCNVIRRWCSAKVMARCAHDNRGDYEGKAWWKVCCKCTEEVEP